MLVQLLSHQIYQNWRVLIDRTVLKVSLMKTCFWFKLACDRQMARPITCHVSFDSGFCLKKTSGPSGF